MKEGKKKQRNKSKTEGEKTKKMKERRAQGIKNEAEGREKD